MMRDVLGVLLLLWSSALALAQSKPAVPPGKPTSGFAVAVIADGFDYTRAGVVARFARDGEGEAIAYDAVDDDRRPFAVAAETSALIERAATLVVPIRVGETAQSWTRALAFLKRSPARVVVVLAPLPSALRESVAAELNAVSDRLILLPSHGAAKLAMPHVLTFASLPPAGAPPVSATMADLVLAPATAAREAPGQPGVSPATAGEAALMAVGLFGCVDVSKARGPADVAAAFVAKGQRGLAGSAPILDLCAGKR
jgi:hypothetical protein